MHAKFTEKIGNNKAKNGIMIGLFYRDWDIVDWDAGMRGIKWDMDAHWCEDF